MIPQTSTHQLEARDSFRPGGFFVMRTPLLPFQALLEWSADTAAAAAESEAAFTLALDKDRVRLRQRLRDIVTQPLVREALFFASPGFNRRLEAYLINPENKRGLKLEQAVTRYFSRMVGRTTPFGLFAGISVGALGDKTQLSVPEVAQCRRATRLAFDYLSFLAAELEQLPAIKENLIYRPNSSLYHLAGRIRYIESRLTQGRRSYYLITVEETDYLIATLARAASGARPAELAAALARDDPGISADEANRYIDELIACQILVSNLPPPVTGQDPLGHMVARLEGMPAAARAARILRQAQAQLNAIDAQGLGAEIKEYDAIAKLLEALPGKASLPNLFQADLVKPAAALTLGAAELAEIIKGIAVFHRLHFKRNDELSRFREAFIARYEDREVPLVEALDSELGIGFDSAPEAAAHASPLLQGLTLASPEEQNAVWGKRQELLARKLGEALLDGAPEIALAERELQELAPADPLPDSFAVIVSLASHSTQALADGDFRILLKGINGPSGANFLSRFGYLGADLGLPIEQLLRAEEALNPEALLAEIAHVPPEPAGVVISRPVLRRFEIPYLGLSGAPPAQQLPLTDLMVSVSRGRVALRSQRLGREVIPRLTSAHNYRGRRNLSAYRFLCALQSQGAAAEITWDWGKLGTFPFLPRVTCGRIVLARARWRVSQEELCHATGCAEAELLKAVLQWRVKRKLPRFIALHETGNELLIDFENALSVATFLGLLKKQQRLLLFEMFPGPTELCASGPEGQFTHELIIPFVRARKALTPPLVPRESIALRQRVFPPGSEWLYAKLYTGAAAIDQLLRDLARPLSAQALRAGATDQWFFVRYNDSGHHLRLRFHGPADRLQAEVLPALKTAITPLIAQGLIWRMQLDTYEREIERYGGIAPAVLAERIFHVDSEAVLSLVEALPADHNRDIRWQLALGGIDLLLTDFGFSLQAKSALMKNLGAVFRREFRADRQLKRQLSEKYRKERKKVETICQAIQRGENIPLPGAIHLQRRSARLKPLIANLQDCLRASRAPESLQGLAPHFIHMYANRLLNSFPRLHELILYDFLDCFYESQLARLKLHVPRP